MSIVDKLRRGFEPRIEAIEKWIEAHDKQEKADLALMTGDKKTDAALTAEVMQLKNEIRMIKARMAKKEPETVG